jgi:hypothetical protein
MMRDVPMCGFSHGKSALKIAQTFSSAFRTVYMSTRVNLRTSLRCFFQTVRILPAREPLHCPQCRAAAMVADSRREYEAFLKGL